MWKLWLGVLLFGGVHLFSMFQPEARSRLIARFGENGYKGLFSLVSVLGLVLLGMAYYAGRSGPASLDMFYAPVEEARHIATLLIFAGFIFIFANQTKGYIRRTVKHPFSLGIILWSVGHLLMNGEKAVVVIFALFLVVAIANIVLSLARGKMPAHEPNWKHDLRAIVVGVVLFFVFALGFHPYVLNIPVLG